MGKRESTSDFEHGTYAGLQEHARLGEKSCKECRAAGTDYARQWRFRTGRQQIPYVCHNCGSVFIDHHCMGPIRFEK